MNETLFSNLKKTQFMKSNKYSDLVKFGLKPKTLMTLSESEINTLHSSLIKKRKLSEQSVTPVQTKGYAVDINSLKDNQPVAAGKSTVEKQGGKLIVSGEMEESEKNNPYAICTSQLSKEFGTRKRSEWTPAQMKKYERCKKDVEKTVKEGKNYFDVLLEKKVVSLLEKHMNPKMTKGDLLRLLEEKKMKTPIGKIGSFGVKEDKDSDTKTKEPKTKPGTKNPPKEKPHDPFKPSPHKQPKPKAKKEETKEAVMDAPAKPKTAPTTKPGTKTPPKEKPHDPFKPSPHKQPKPKARKRLPSWLTFNSLGIKFKK
jgi:hypothetical protein